MPVTGKMYVFYFSCSIIELVSPSKPLLPYTLIVCTSPYRARLAKFHSKTGASENRSSRAMAKVYFSDDPQILYRAQTSAQLHPGHMICPGGTGTTTHLIQSAA